MENKKFNSHKKSKFSMFFSILKKRRHIFSETVIFMIDVPSDVPYLMYICVVGEFDEFE